MKIGIIQSCCTAGDLSGNLRRVVQGCRRCHERGAELTVAAAHALDGAFPDALRSRSSFLLQAQAALHALAAETRRPLLLASYAAEPGESEPERRPYLLCAGEVQPLENRRLSHIGGLAVYVDASARPTPPPQGMRCDLILHLPDSPWHTQQQDSWRRLASDEARIHSCQVAIVQGVACSAGRLMAGGSVLASKHAMRSLPMFRAAEGFFPLRKPRAVQQATEDSTPPPLADAACFCLREMIEQRGYSGAAIFTGGPYASLLLALARLSLGSDRAWALGEAPVTRISRRRLALPHGRDERDLLCRCQAVAEERNLLLLSPLSLRELMLGLYSRPAALHGAFAPLGDMLGSEIHTLTQQLRRRLPHPLQELLPDNRPDLDLAEEEALHRLVRENRSPAEILARHGGSESLLHSLLRKIAASAAEPLPPCLHISPPRLPFPPHHGLME